MINLNIKGRRQLKPLSASLSFVFEGGGPSQSIDASTGLYTPDWSFTPIRITPMITILDPEGLAVAPDGITKKTWNSFCSPENLVWTYDKSNIGDTEQTAISGQEIFMDKSDSDLRGSLNIRKNFPETKTLKFEFTYTTTAEGVQRTVVFSDTIAIKVNQMSESKVQSRAEYPRGQIFQFPSTEIPPKRAMKMGLYYGGKQIPALYKWFEIKNGSEVANPTTSDTLEIEANQVSRIKNFRCKALDIRKEYEVVYQEELTKAVDASHKARLGADYSTTQADGNPKYYVGYLNKLITEEISKL